MSTPSPDHTCRARCTDCGRVLTDEPSTSLVRGAVPEHWCGACEAHHAGDCPPAEVWRWAVRTKDGSLYRVANESMAQGLASFRYLRGVVDLEPEVVRSRAGGVWEVAP